MGPMGYPDMQVEFYWSGRDEFGVNGYPVGDPVIVNVPYAAITWNNWSMYFSSAPRLELTKPTEAGD